METMALDQAKFHWNSSKRKRIDGPFSQSVFHGKFGQCDLSLSSSIMNMVKNLFFQYVCVVMVTVVKCVDVFFTSQSEGSRRV